MSECAPGRVDELVAACRQWATGPVPMRHTRLPRGGVMSVRTVCVGWPRSFRTPYTYTRTASDVNGARVAAFPEWLAELGRRAVAEAYEDPEAGAAYAPDTALVNFYDDGATTGMHQDKDERSSAPVVSLSIGDTCVFRFGNTETRTRPYTDVELESWDLFVFGGPSRYACHGVPKVRPGTGDPATGPAGGGPAQPDAADDRAERLSDRTAERLPGWADRPAGRAPGRRADGRTAPAARSTGSCGGRSSGGPAGPPEVRDQSFSSTKLLVVVPPLVMRTVATVGW